MARLLPLLLLLVLSLGVPVDAAPRAAGLTVKSKPSGATVWVDGAAVGSTPLSLTGVPAGSHTVVVGAPGFRLWSKRVRVNRSGRANVQARLKAAKPLPLAQRAAARSVLLQNAGYGLEWRTLMGVAADLTGGFGLPGMRAAGQRGVQAAADSEAAGYYLDVTMDPAGGITALFYLDEALTELAGQMAVSLSGLGISLDYSFTGGEFANATGHLEAGADGTSAGRATGQGTLSDGSEWSADLRVGLSGETLTLTGSVSLAHPDGSTSEWQVEGTSTGGDAVVTTSTGYRLELHLDTDGSGAGTLFGPDSADPLAVFSWNAEGQGTVTYGDGTTESFGLD